MKRIVLVLALVLCSSCAISARLSTITIQDATDAVSNAQLADDPAAVQCFASKLEMSEKAAQLKFSGAMSKIAALRALRKWSEQVELDCAVVITEAMRWARRWFRIGVW